MEAGVGVRVVHLRGDVVAHVARKALDEDVVQVGVRAAVLKMSNVRYYVEENLRILWINCW